MDELNYVDLALLERIDESTILEKFGMTINSSFFDAANMLGTLKQKGYVDIIPQFPGPTRIVVSQKGRDMLAVAKAKGEQEIERLDEVIISLIANGYREPEAIASKLNLRSSDLALHLFRVVSQGFVVSMFKSGKLELNLTDAGFVRAGYPPVGTEAEMEKESSEVEELLQDKEEEPGPEEGPVKQYSGKKLKGKEKLLAKAEFYVLKFSKYVIIAAVVFLLLLLAIIAFYALKIRI